MKSKHNLKKLTERILVTFLWGLCLNLIFSVGLYAEKNPKFAEFILPELPELLIDAKVERLFLSVEIAKVKNIPRQIVLWDAKDAKNQGWRDRKNISVSRISFPMMDYFSTGGKKEDLVFKVGWFIQEETKKWEVEESYPIFNQGRYSVQGELPFTFNYFDLSGLTFVGQPNGKSTLLALKGIMNLGESGKKIFICKGGKDKRNCNKVKFIIPKSKQARKVKIEFIYRDKKSRKVNRLQWEHNGEDLSALGNPIVLKDLSEWIN